MLSEFIFLATVFENTPDKSIELSLVRMGLNRLTSRRNCLKLQG